MAWNPAWAFRPDHRVHGPAVGDAAPGCALVVPAIATVAAHGDTTGDGGNCRLAAQLSAVLAFLGLD